MTGQPDTPPSPNAQDETATGGAPYGQCGRRRTGRAGRAGPYLVRGVLSVITIAFGVWAGLQWSLISEKADNRISQTSWAEEGPAFKVLILHGGRTLTIDDGLLTRLGGPKAVIGKRLQTKSLSTTARIDDRTIRLRWSATATRTVVVLVLLCGFGAWRTARRRRAPYAPNRGQEATTTSERLAELPVRTAVKRAVRGRRRWIPGARRLPASVATGVQARSRSERSEGRP